MNKTVTMVVLLVVILLALGLYFINSLPPDEESSATPSTESPVDTGNTEEDVPATATQTYLDPEIGLSFTYKSGSEGYVLDTLEGTESNNIKNLRLVSTVDSALLNDGGAHDGPPTILIRVFEKGATEDPEEWAREYAAISNLNLIMGEIDETELAGASAIRYTIDGLYPTDTVIAIKGEFVYVISGSYLDSDSPTKKDFDPLLRTIEFNT